MLFQYTWQHVIEETKTQTRRPVKPGEYAIRTYCNQIAAVFQSNREKWRVGSDYAVQIGRGSHQIGRIRLLRIRSEYLTRISTADAYAEGFENRQAFIDAWRMIHGSQSQPQRVWVLEFELIAVTVEFHSLTRPNAFAFPHIANS